MPSTHPWRTNRDAGISVRDGDALLRLPSAMPLTVSFRDLKGVVVTLICDPDTPVCVAAQFSGPEVAHQVGVLLDSCVLYRQVRR